MKKILFFVFLCAGLVAHAQGMSYTPFIPNNSLPTLPGDSYNHARPRSTAPSATYDMVRTNAYYADYNGNYYKVPIKVKITNYSNGYSTAEVVAEWKSYGYEGKWENMTYASKVQKCSPIHANGYSKQLEQQFMYKAQVLSKWYYFDL